MSEYLEFIETGDTGKTKIFMVRSKHGGGDLALVKWYGPWRQYVMFPMTGTAWNPDCLADIITFIRGLMADRKTKCPGGFHTYLVTGDDAEPCERCGKPYNEMDVAGCLPA